MELPFVATGPARERSIALPPQRKFLADYVLVYDERRRATVYLASPDFHQLGHAWTYDGASFTPISETSVRTESPSQRWQGVWDASRDAVVAWNFGKDDDYAELAYAVVLDASGPRFFVPRGESPTRGDGADETGGAFAFDRRRGVTVCLTARGVWELGADDAWTKRRDEIGLPTSEWKEECWGAAWDPKSERTFFAFVAEDEDEDDRFWLYAWDGTTLELLPNEGLPPGRITGWMHTGPVLVSHPEGVVADFGGEVGAMLWRGTGWEAWRTSSSPRPASSKAWITWDPSLDAFVAGPGRYEPTPDAYPRDQHVFYVGREDGWTKLGVTEQKSAISELWAKRLGTWSAGRWRMIGNQSLTLIEWSDAGWVTVTDAQKSLWSGGSSGNDANVLAGMAEADDGTLHLVTNEGQVFVLDEGSKAWRSLTEPDAAWKRRLWTALAWDAKGGRWVAWGGTLRGRASNQVLTFVPKDGVWKKAKKASPQPSAFARGPDDRRVEHQLVYDHGLEAVVRVGFDEAAVLDGEVFVPFSPPGMGALNGDTWRAVASDARTGETLVVSFETGVVFRFDLGGCEEIARFVLPDDLRLGHVDEAMAFRAICDDWVFDPQTRALHVQNPDDAWGRYVLALGDAFEAAAKLGPRTRPGEQVAPRSLALYGELEGVPCFWLAKAEGKRVEVASGPVGSTPETETIQTKTSEAASQQLDALASAQRTRGFVSASELDATRLRRLACVPTRSLVVGEPTSATASGSRLGGQPSGGGTWPTTDRAAYQQIAWHLPEELNFFELPEEDREEVVAELREGATPEPLGFLLQIETGELLHRHAGLAVYVDTSGCATESLLHNRVRLLTREELDAPATSSPVPSLEARALTIGAPGHELDPERTALLTAHDPELAAALEALEALDLPRSDGFSKLGGRPTWVQHSRTFLSAERVPYRFVLQLDFDGLGGALDAWPDAGLFGVLYVFVAADESAACAIWQYT